jgi:hypothetical protein
MERYLARTAFAGQQTDVPVAPGRPDYLFAPLDDEEDRGSHGPFDAQAHPRSPQAALSRHRRAVLIAVAGLAAALAERR